ncbi:MAG: hypothetical protein F6K41_37450 [Symploca sp. SIO3E6]|nr:hypothetical protein [Caldora sp. SIO3E6]
MTIFLVKLYDTWTQAPNGNIRLTARAIDEVDAFFQHLVNVTDLGMKNHIQGTYSISVSW